MKKSRIISIILSLCIIFTQVNVFAKQDFFYDELIDVNTSASEVISAQNENGYVPPVVYIDGFGEVLVNDIANQTPTFYNNAYFPAKYSAVEKGYITSVKDQKNEGVCWAFATLSAIETSLIKKNLASVGDVDYSETHLSYFAHSVNEAFGDGEKKYTASGGYYDGDNQYQAGFYLAGWQGAELEENQPYPPSSKDYTIDESQRYNSYAHLQNYSVIPSTQNEIKQGVMDYGSVVIAYYSDSDYYGEDNTNYYCSLDNDINHAVSVVGWDDTYSAENFKNTPSTDGAWLIKNSWGTNWGNDGYFWMSYDEKSIELATVFDAESADNYHYIHQYDGARSNFWTQASKSANVFTAESKQTLKAVGINVFSACEYDIEVYKLNDDFENPISDTLVSKASGIKQYMGYYTIELDNDVELMAGDKFSVVVSFEGNMPYHLFEGGNHSSDYYESYYFDGNVWYDAKYLASDNVAINNACIKAYSVAENFSVTYKDGDVSLQTISVYDGCKLEIPDNPQKENLYFAGWFKDSSLSDEWNFDEDRVEKDTVLYARWTDTPVLVSQITLSIREKGVLVGDNLTINKEVYPYYATDKEIIWESENTTGISVSNGVVTGLTAGTYTVCAKSNDGNAQSQISVNVYDKVKNVRVAVQRPVFKTSDIIYYGIFAENALSCDLYLITPENVKYKVTNIKSGASLRYTYTTGIHKIYIVAYDALGNETVSGTNYFLVTDSPAMVCVKSPSKYQLGAYNGESTSKLMMAKYDGDKLSSIETLTNIGSLNTVNRLADDKTVKFIWWNDLNQMIPVMRPLSIDATTLENDNVIYFIE